MEVTGTIYYRRGCNMFGLHVEGLIMLMILGRAFFNKTVSRVFFFESIRLISLRLCGAPVYHPGGVAYPRENGLHKRPAFQTKEIWKYPSSTATPSTGPSPNKVCPRHHAPTIMAC